MSDDDIRKVFVCIVKHNVDFTDGDDNKFAFNSDGKSFIYKEVENFSYAKYIDITNAIYSGTSTDGNRNMIEVGLNIEGSSKLEKVFSKVDLDVLALDYFNSIVSGKSMEVKSEWFQDTSAIEFSENIITKIHNNLTGTWGTKAHMLQGSLQYFHNTDEYVYNYRGEATEASMYECLHGPEFDYRVTLDNSSGDITVIQAKSAIVVMCSTRKLSGTSGSAYSFHTDFDLSAMLIISDHYLTYGGTKYRLGYAEIGNDGAYEAYYLKHDKTDTSGDVVHVTLEEDGNAYKVKEIKTIEGHTFFLAEIAKYGGISEDYVIDESKEKFKYTYDEDTNTGTYSTDVTHYAQSLTLSFTATQGNLPVVVH